MCRKMLDIKLLKEKPEYVKQRLLTRNSDYSAEIDRILEADVQRRSLITDTEQLRAKQNSASKEIPKLKKEGKDTSEIFEEMRKLSDKVKADSDKIDDLDSEIESLL
ncbi:MAG: serine--tRNA ligase, partial [Clostridia bacterium]|nr:serine--tRNA ligase [Clostridia bacterium]